MYTGQWKDNRREGKLGELKWMNGDEYIGEVGILCDSGVTFSHVSAKSGSIISGPELVYYVGHRAGAGAAMRANFSTTNSTATVASPFVAFGMMAIGNAIAVKAGGR